MGMARAGNWLPIPTARHQILSLHTAVSSGIAVFFCSGAARRPSSLESHLTKFSRLEGNLSRKERYHCYSLDAAQFEGAEYASEETPETQMEQELDTERIAYAVASGRFFCAWK